MKTRNELELVSVIAFMALVVIFLAMFSCARPVEYVALRGLTGAIGATGVAGQDGVDGQNGLDGVTGVTGVTGATGSQGIQGADGATGSQGNTGNTGNSGLNGAIGATGAQGAVGPSGVNGATGATGQAGTQIGLVKFCPEAPHYPNTFPEYGLCINSNLYAVYSANGGFLAFIPPGHYDSHGIGSTCSFTVTNNCGVEHE